MQIFKLNEIDLTCGCQAKLNWTDATWTLTRFCDYHLATIAIAAERDRLKAENAELVEVAQGVCDYFDVIGKIRDRGIPDGMYEKVNVHITTKGSELLKRARIVLAKAKGDA